MWLCCAVLAVVLLALVATGLVILPQRRAAGSNAPVVVARTEAVNFFTLGYRDIDADLASVVKLATSPFKEQYTAKRSTVKQGIVAGKLTSTAAVGDGATAVEMQTGSKVVVLVAVDATTTAPQTSAAKAAAQTDRYRMRLTVVKIHGNWLVSSIEQVG